MARYKAIDTSPRFLAVDLEKQLLPGSFEHAVHHLLDHEFDLSRFDTRYRNDQNGASAYPPGMLLKVILCAYAQGVVSSRGIERLCREHVTFIALSGDSAPHFTTLAAFVSSLDEEVAQLFAQVLYLCDRQGLIGREMFAIDGVKLPSNASKAKSGTRADFAHQADKLEAAAKKMLERHRENDRLPVEPDLAEKARHTAESLSQEAAELRQWLADHPKDRKGSKGAIRKSNRTDPESAKMATSKGVIQGFTGVAAVDAKHQIIIEAQAHGTGSEQELLLAGRARHQAQATPDTLYTADAGYHSEANLKALAEENINALIADNGMRQRDERFKDQGKHKAEARSPLRQGAPEESRQTLPATGLHVRSGNRHLHLSGRQTALPQRHELHPQRPPRHQIQRHPARLPALRTTGQMPAHTGEDESPAGRLLSGQSQYNRRKPHRPDEAGHRQRRRQSPLRETICHRRTGVRQYPAQQTIGSVHATRAEEGRYAVEAVLPGAQHRETGASRVRAVESKGQSPHRMGFT
jgi:transposase